jgi:hypothetical protein
MATANYMTTPQVKTQQQNQKQWDSQFNQQMQQDQQQMQTQQKQNQFSAQGQGTQNVSLNRSPMGGNRFQANFGQSGGNTAYGGGGGGMMQTQQSNPYSGMGGQQQSSWAKQNQPQMRTQGGGSNLLQSMGITPQMQTQQQNPYSGYASSAMNTQGGSDRPRDDVRPGDYVGPAPGGSSWSLPQWNPTIAPPPNAPITPATPGGVEKNFFGTQDGSSDMMKKLFDPNSYTANDSEWAKYVATTLPVAQFGQNNYTDRRDFTEAQYRDRRDYGTDIWRDTWQMGLSERQQLAAEEQARIATKQFYDQFDHTKEMDMLGYGLSKEQIGNEFTMGMDQNQATRDVANTYAGAQQYGADQQLAGTLGSANIYAGAQNYGAELGLQGQLGSAGMYSGAQRYQADQDLAAAKYQWDMQQRMNQAMMANNLQVANISAYGRSQAPNTQWARSWN